MMSMKPALSGASCSGLAGQFFAIHWAHPHNLLDGISAFCAGFSICFIPVLFLGLISGYLADIAHSQYSRTLGGGK